MAGFEKGMPRPPGAGRKKGSKNKPKPKGVYEILYDLNIDPVHHLLGLIKTGKMQDKDKARVWMELMSYCYAKPRAEMNVELNNPSDEIKNKTITEVGTKIIKAIEKWNG